MTTWLTDEPLLTAAEERALAREIEAGVLASDLLATGSWTGVATADELLALERGGQQAWQRFLLANLRLVWQVAHREARRSGLPADDLFQEGFLGLAVALRRWDHTRGIRFATLALPWIRTMIGDVTATQGGAVGVPGWVGCEARRMRGLQSQLSQEQGRAVTPDDVAHYLGARRGRVVRLLSCAAPDALLDADGHVRDPAAAQSSEHPLAGEVAGLVASLPERERAVLELRFGFGGGESHSQAEAAKRLRMSESTVRRLERGALAVLRRAALKLQAA